MKEQFNSLDDIETFAKENGYVFSNLKEGYYLLYKRRNPNDEDIHAIFKNGQHFECKRYPKENRILFEVGDNSQPIVQNSFIDNICCVIKKLWKL